MTEFDATARTSSMPPVRQIDPDATPEQVAKALLHRGTTPTNTDSSAIHG